MQKITKKIVAIGLTMLCLSSLVACGKKEQGPGEPTERLTISKQFSDTAIQIQAMNSGKSQVDLNVDQGAFYDYNHIFANFRMLVDPMTEANDYMPTTYIYGTKVDKIYQANKSDEIATYLGKIMLNVNRLNQETGFNFRCVSQFNASNFTNQFAKFKDDATGLTLTYDLVNTEYVKYCFETLKERYNPEEGAYVNPDGTEYFKEHPSVSSSVIFSDAGELPQTALDVTLLALHTDDKQKVTIGKFKKDDPAMVNALILYTQQVPLQGETPMYVKAKLVAQTEQGIDPSVANIIMKYMAVATIETEQNSN